MRRKFKVGDRVIGIGADVLGNDIDHKTGTVIEVGTSYDCKVKFDKNILDWRDYEKTMTVNKRNLMKIEGDNAVLVYKDGTNRVVATDLTTGKEYVAKCHPEDEFDFDTGAEIAFKRYLRRNEVREVKRMAKVGEYIKIVSPWFTLGKYHIGDIFQVQAASSRTNCVDIINIDGDKEYVDGSEYVVLENYNPEDNKTEKVETRNKLEIRPKMSIWCETKEEIEKCSAGLTKLGYTWTNGVSLINYKINEVPCKLTAHPDYTVTWTANRYVLYDYDYINVDFKDVIFEKEAQFQVKNAQTKIEDTRKDARNKIEFSNNMAIWCNNPKEDYECAKKLDAMGYRYANGNKISSYNKEPVRYFLGEDKTVTYSLSKSFRSKTQDYVYVDFSDVISPERLLNTKICVIRSSEHDIVFKRGRIYEIVNGTFNTDSFTVSHDAFRNIDDLYEFFKPCEKWTKPSTQYWCKEGIDFVEVEE